MSNQWSNVNSKILEPYQHTNMLKDWTLSYHQLSSGIFESHLNEISFDGIQIYEENLKPAMFQRGEGRENALCLGIFSELTTPALWMGKTIIGHEVISVCRGGDILLRSPENSSFFALTIPFEILDHEKYMRMSAGTNLLSHPQISEHFYRRLYCILNNILKHTTLLGINATRAQLKSEIIELSHDYLEVLGQHQEPLRISNHKAKKVVLKTLEAIESNKDCFQSIDELCKMTFTSRRTLQNCFEQITGQSPALFLKQFRLNAVRKVLAQSEHPVVICDVAMEWGFWHLSQFSADYKKLFQEMPSQTLSKNHFNSEKTRATLQ